MPGAIVHRHSQMPFSAIRSSRSTASGNSRYSRSGSEHARTRLAEFAPLRAVAPARPLGRLSRFDGQSSTARRLEFHCRRSDNSVDKVASGHFPAVRISMAVNVMSRYQPTHAPDPQLPLKRGFGRSQPRSNADGREGRLRRLRQPRLSGGALTLRARIDLAQSLRAPYCSPEGRLGMFRPQIYSRICSKYLVMPALWEHDGITLRTVAERVFLDSARLPHF